MAAFSSIAIVASGQTFPTTVETSSISLNSADTVKFIQLYQQQELLWNVSLPDHPNKTKRSECLMKISHLMGYNWTEQQVKDKILSLRSRYSKELVKVRVSIAAGAEQYTPVWRFFPLLDSFLRPFCTTRKTNTPVVRAFHQRLMAGMGQVPNSSSSLMQASHPTITAHRGHFHNLPANANSYYDNYQILTPPDNGNQDDNDDDVQIVEEEFAAEIVQEEAVYIDDDDDYNDDDSQQGGTSDDKSSFQESADGSSSGTENQKHFAGNRGHSDSDNGCQDNTPQTNVQEECPGENLSATPENTAINENAVTLESSTFLMSEAARSSHSKEASLLRDADQTSSVGGHGNTTQQVEPDDSNEHPEMGGVKQERYTTPPSPPAPPLPSKHSVLAAPSGSQDNGHFCDSVDTTLTSGQPSVLTGQSAVNNGLFQVSPGDTRHSNSTGFHDEPVRKRIKQEIVEPLPKEHGLPRMVHVGSSQMNSTVENHRCFGGNSTDARHFSTVKQINTTNRKGLSAVVTNPQQLNHTATSEAANQITNQVTNVMTSQMSNLLHALVTNIVERSSPVLATDSELAFVNHVVCELRKLDEDLQADVKFSIQKALYNAQKEMRHRKNQVSYSKDTG